MCKHKDPITVFALDRTVLGHLHIDFGMTKGSAAAIARDAMLFSSDNFRPGSVLIIVCHNPSRSFQPCVKIVLCVGAYVLNPYLWQEVSKVNQLQQDQ